MKRINIEVSDELVVWKEQQGLKWRVLTELGREAVDLRFERNALKVEVEKLIKANAHLQNTLLVLQDENDKLKEGVKPCA